jgi:predicted ester cyclase
MTNTELFQTWYEEVWNKANENYITEALHPNAVIHGLQTDPGKTGSEAFIPFYKSFREQFPDVQVKVQPIFNYDDFVAAECNVTATHASGKKANFSGLSIAKYADGKLVEGWNGFDFLTLYQRVGLKLSE